MGKSEKVFVKLDPLFTIMQHMKEEQSHYTEEMKKEEYWRDTIQALREIEQDVFIWFPWYRKLYEQRPAKLYESKEEK